MMRTMTEPAESTAAPGLSPHDDRGERPSGLGQAVAVVAIAAGVVFVVAVVFFWGLLLGGSGGFDGRSVDQTGPGGNSGTCPMMGGDGMMGPSQLPPTPTPGMPRP